MSKFVKARENPAKLLDLVDETFDQMPLAVHPAVIVALGFCPLVRRNDGFCSPLGNLVNQGLGGVASISNDVFGFQSRQQVRRLGNLMRLPRRQAQAQGIAQGIHHHMHFGTEPTPATSQRLRRLTAAFFVRLPRTGERAQSCCQSSHFPCRHRWQKHSAFAPTPPHCTTGQTAYRYYSSSHTRSAAVATVRHCARSITRLRQIGGTAPLVPHTHSGRLSRMPEFSSIRRQIVSHLSFDQFTSNVNRT